MADIELGEKLNEGKTKIVYALPNQPCVLLQAKDMITAGGGAKSHDLKGKSALANTTTVEIFKLLNNAGIRTHFVRGQSDTAFVARNCQMIPIEWVTRRIATGSFLKRNPGVKEGYRFSPPKIETFFKDDANNDPQWSREQIIAAEYKCAGVQIGNYEVDVMNAMTQCVFEILESAWASVDCCLVDMKVEYGIDVETGEMVLADVIDNDSWRLWPSGDKRLMKDKQVFRDMDKVTDQAMQTVKRNFEWVAEKVKELQSKPKGRAVVIMGSPSDTSHCKKIQDACAGLGVPCELRVSSAHKGTTETLEILAQYEGEGIPTVFIAVAGRSNGLGPVLSGNATWPVINCPPLSAEWGSQDVWSSLRLPSGLGCATVMSPDTAALHASQILSLSDHNIWARLRAKKLNTWISLKKADRDLQKASVTNGH